MHSLRMEYSEYSNDSGNSDNGRSAIEFWQEIDSIVQRRCETQGYIDETLKAYMRSVVRNLEYLETEADWAKLVYKFLDGHLFSQHQNYLRRRLIGRLYRETSKTRLHIAATILLYDGRQNPKTFELMMHEGAFGRLTEIILAETEDEDHWVQKRMLELLYEMSRIQRLRREDLEAVDDDFVSFLLEMIERAPEADDPYHYAVVRVLLVLNEQYMVSAHDPVEDGSSPAGELTNKVIKTLCFKGPDYKTFGENIILVLNRETETSLQLLILKLLYLLFTTSATHEYFYTNDLRVLVDVIIRNLLDLPDEAQSLRHTYLRVLYPLLTYSQLRHPPHYKCAQLKELFHVLSTTTDSHFQPIDDTTLRLVKRCTTVPWLAENPPPATEETTPSPTDSDVPTTAATPANSSPSTPPKPPSPARSKYLGISHQASNDSTLSVAEMARMSEKPGVEAPSKTGRTAKMGRARPPPPPPRKRKPKQALMMGPSPTPSPAAVARADVSQKA